MKTRILLILAGLLTTIGLIGVPLPDFTRASRPTPAPKATGEAPPNILLIIDDQHSRRALGVSGNAIVKTPRLDRLAAEGIWFSQGYCNDPICGPSRYSMLSGRYPSEIGALVNSMEPNADLKLLPEYLNELGYFTASAGKNHFSDKQASHGFQKIYPHAFYNVAGDSPYTQWYEENFHELGCEGEPYFWAPERGWVHRLDPTKGLCTINPHPAELSQEHWTTERALDLIRESQEREEPFFVQASYFAPHHPYGPLQEFYDLYEGVEMELPESWYLPECERQKDFDEAEYKSIMRHYYAFVSQVDHYIGELLDGLEEMGLADDTLVIMVSDHGDMMGEFGQLRKGSPAEGALAIPFFVRWPNGLTGGKQVDAPVSLIDVLPTIFDAIGEDPPEVARGSSLLPLIEGRQEAREREVLAMDIRRDPFLFLVARDERFKLILTPQGSTARVQLYDIQADPWELRDLSREPELKSDRRRLVKKLLDFWEEQSKFLDRGVLKRRNAPGVQRGNRGRKVPTEPSEAHREAGS